MEKEFVPYVEAEKLRQLGFNELCLTYYKNDKLSDILDFNRNIYCELKNVNNEINYYISAPTFSQAFRWFREKYNIQSTVEPTKDQHRFEVGFNYWIWNTVTAEEWFTEPRDRPSGDWIFKTYEEAEIECLRKLIEIIKN